MFVDQAKIFIRSGKGGDGCVSFRREKYIPRGGPDGGDGGDGGSVFVVATSSVETLLDFSSKHHWRAENGRPGMGKKRFGRNGKDLVIELPPGTLIYDDETGILLKDLSVCGVRVCLAEGGKGGRGNARFATATHQVPREAEPGTLSVERTLRLDLKLIADVAVVGLPNAGKSTLLSRMSKARPKIAAYPFTTLTPQLGIVELSDERRVVMADIPGLIEGAHEGAGLGDDFLRHIERTRTIVHIVDVSAAWSAHPPAEAYRIIRNELEKYSPMLASKREIVVGNKIDALEDADAIDALSAEIQREVVPVSAVVGTGLVALGERMWDMVQSAKTSDEEDTNDADKTGDTERTSAVDGANAIARHPDEIQLPTPPHRREEP